MSFTYATLKTAIQNYTQNDETSFVTSLPIFIRLAEERILKSVQLNIFQKNVSGSMSSGNQYLAAPSDFLVPFLSSSHLLKILKEDQYTLLSPKATYFQFLLNYTYDVASLQN